MNVVFRVDSSMQLGTGHVMRCLALANKIKQEGGTATFICRNHDGHICSTIKEQGHSVIIFPLARLDIELLTTNSSYIETLGSSIEDDAVETIDAINGNQPDWLIVDHYDIDSIWHIKLRSCVNNIFVIDDIAGKKIDCDLLLNQNLGCQENIYDGIMSDGYEFLLGTKYTLLRPEFNKLRNDAFVKREKLTDVKNILITFGGLDVENYSGVIVDELNEIEFGIPIEVNVVLGKHAPHYQSLLSKASSYKNTVNIFSNVTNMAELMLNADVSFGAAGSTSWERCCLGLPAILVVLAENQFEAASQLEDSGGIINLGYIHDVDILKTWMRNNLPLTSEKLEEMSLKAFDVVDGKGVERVYSKMNSFV
jgi:UDP-2,4-diacetamido-2,4,6-trideoxy-beta-L-altropyranose hydrolase